MGNQLMNDVSTAGRVNASGRMGGARLGNQSMNTKSTGWANQSMNNKSMGRVKASRFMGGAYLKNQVMNNVSTGRVNASGGMGGARLGDQLMNNKSMGWDGPID